MSKLVDYADDFSRGLAEMLGEKHGRTFSQSTADGVNYLTNGKIQDNNSDFVHLLMIVGTIGLLGPKEAKFFGVFTWLSVILLWAIGQNENAVRSRNKEKLLKAMATRP